jgi:hypothetical protein
MEYKIGDLVKHKLMGLLEVTEILSDDYIKLKPYKVSDSFARYETYLLNIKMAPIKLHKRNGE